MSTAIVKFDNSPMMFYCKEKSYPCGLGFDLLKICESSKNYLTFLCDGEKRFVKVDDVPTDIQYEYVITDKGIRAQECWYTADKSYHGGGFRHGGKFDLKSIREQVELQSMYSYRNEKYWE